MERAVNDFVEKTPPLLLSQPSTKEVATLAVNNQISQGQMNPPLKPGSGLVRHISEKSTATSDLQEMLDRYIQGLTLALGQKQTPFQSSLKSSSSEGSSKALSLISSAHWKTSHNHPDHHPRTPHPHLHQILPRYPLNHHCHPHSHLYHHKNLLHFHLPLPLVPRYPHCYPRSSHME